MDKEVRHKRRAALANQWESAEESDTESLAQERAYQKLSAHQNKYLWPHKGNIEGVQQWNREEENAQDGDTEALQVYDSLEVVEVLSNSKRRPSPLKEEHVETTTQEKGATSQSLSGDAYYDLQYDPNQRAGLEGAGHFQSSQSSTVEYNQGTKEKCGDRQEVMGKEGYRFISSSPAVMVTLLVTDDRSDQPYHLHQQDGPNSSVTSPHCHSHALHLRSSGAEGSGPSGDTDNTSQRGFRKNGDNNCGNDAENMDKSAGLTEDADAMYIQEWTNCPQKLHHSLGGAAQTRHVTLLSPKKEERCQEDIVERNKITLGRNTAKCSSYATVHALKQDVSPKEKKVTQISKGKKAQLEDRAKPSQKQWQQTADPAVRAVQEDCLSLPLAGTQPEPQKTPSSQPLPPTFYPNTSSHLLPFFHDKSQDEGVNLVALQGDSHWCLSSVPEPTLSPGYQQTNPGKFFQMSQNGVNAKLHKQPLEKISDLQQRTNAFKWPLSREAGEPTWSPNGIYSHQFPLNLSGTPSTSTLSFESGSYTVLPPIGKAPMGRDPDQSPVPNLDVAYPIHRSRSNGYLSQMEKQKQLKKKVTYKAYSLKDYEQLRPDIKLQGLGPDYKATEKTKMKRQRLYSNVIREQNKKISRIPFLLAKDPEGDDKKVPRMKALEYAKTIARPPVQPQPKDRRKLQTQSFIALTPDFEVFNVSQSASLEALKKRHEDEKKAVALFRKVHVI